MRTVLEDQYPSICIGNHGSRLMKKQSSTSINPPLLSTSKITPISLSLFRSRVWKDASNDGALRSTRCVALGSRPLLYQIFAIKRSERPKPHSRLLVTRGLHTLDFDTLATLAPGSKLQPRLSVLGRKPQASTRRRPTMLLEIRTAQQSTGEGDRQLRHWAGAATF